MFCTTCAAPNDRANRSCAACGAGLDSGAGAGAVDPRAAAEAGRPGVRTVALLVLRWAPVALLAVMAASAAVVAGGNEARLHAAYERGMVATAAGDYLAAAAAFSEAGSHLDAPARLADANTALEPLRLRQDAGIAALERGDHAAAIDLLLPVAIEAPGLGDAIDRLADARRGLAERLEREAGAAENRRDWIAAESNLRQLAALDPANDAAQTRLADLLAAHGPLVIGRDRDLWLVAPDGSDATPLTQGVQALWPVWSPDRSRVAFLSVDPQDPSGDVALMVVQPGALPETLARSISAHAAPTWSPDGRLLAFTSFADYDPVLETGPIGVRTVDVETGLETNVTGDRFDLAFNPVFSPDSRRIAFIAKERRYDERPQHAPGDVWLADTAGLQFSNLTNGSTPDAWSVHWQPGGDLLLVYSLYGQSWYEPPQSALRLYDPATGAFEVVDSGSPDPLGAPAWAPDGGRFAWVSGDRTIRMRDGASEREWEAAQTLSNDLTWAPDGSVVLASALDGSQPSALLRRNPVTGWADAALSEVTIAYDSDQPFVGPPQWSAPGVAVTWPGAAPAGAGLDALP